MHVVLKEYVFFSIVFAAFYLSSNSVRTGKGRGVVVKQNADMRGQGERNGLKTGRNVRRSFKDDSYRELQAICTMLIAT